MTKSARRYFLHIEKRLWMAAVVFEFQGKLKIMSDVVYIAVLLSKCDRVSSQCCCVHGDGTQLLT